VTTIQHALERLTAGNDLDVSESYAVFCTMMDGQSSDVETAALLTALKMKGEAVPEIVGAARAMQERAAPIRTKHHGALDTCGTGGDELRTFNISTAAAFVAAACGVTVPKHGNRSVSSSSGSADVLEQLGVNINLTPDQVTQCLDELNIGFCFAPLFHVAMRNVAPVRKQLRFRTIFNLLGPLTNPASAEYQLVGAGRRDTAARLARALAELGRRHAFVVCGADQLDEVSLWGMTTAFEVIGSQIVEQRWTAQSFGLPECRVEDLQIASPADSARVLREVFSGGAGPARDIVVANAAAALLAAVKVANLREGVEQAAAAIDSGRVRDLVVRLADKTQRLAQSASP
jgi:anthranilate phosphoribosyltransferase